MIIIFGNTEWATTSVPEPQPLCGRSYWVEVLWRNGELPIKSFFCVVICCGFFCIATQWAQPLKPEFQKRSFHWSRQPRSTWPPFYQLGWGCSLGHPSAQRCSLLLTRWTLSGDHVRYMFSWPWKYPPAHQTPSLWTQGETEQCLIKKSCFIPMNPSHRLSSEWWLGWSTYNYLRQGGYVSTGLKFVKRITKSHGWIWMKSSELRNGQRNNWLHFVGCPCRRHDPDMSTILQFLKWCRNAWQKKQKKNST